MDLRLDTGTLSKYKSLCLLACSRLAYPRSLNNYYPQNVLAQTLALATSLSRLLGSQKHKHIQI